MLRYGYSGGVLGFWYGCWGGYMLGVVGDGMYGCVYA